jgi:hypothetical protein
MSDRDANSDLEHARHWRPNPESLAAAAGATPIAGANRPSRPRLLRAREAREMPPAARPAGPDLFGEQTYW